MSEPRSDHAPVLAILLVLVVALWAMLGPAFAAPAGAPLDHDALMERLRDNGYYAIDKLGRTTGHWEGEAVHAGAWVRFQADPRTGRVLVTRPID